MCLSIVPLAWGHPGLLLRTMHGGANREVFRIGLLSPKEEVPYQVACTPSLCRLKSDVGLVELCFASHNALRIRGQGVKLRLLAVPLTGCYAFEGGGASWQLNCPPNNVKYLVTPLKGEIAVQSRPKYDGPAPGAASATDSLLPCLMADLSPDQDGTFEAAIEEFITTPRRSGLTSTFNSCVERVEREWQAWVRRMPLLAPMYAEAGERAMYLTWSSVVGAGGCLKRDTMLMSKNWMTRCWSWDHCFNALALAYRQPDLAWDQFMIPFDWQDEFGALPDCVEGANVCWNFCKPPIHGWALNKMLAQPHLVTGERLRDIYPRLVRWTEWWEWYRDNDSDGLPEYHHGNDSGWDNASVFDGGYPVTGPDLAACLVLQMDLLADLATRLDNEAEQKRWRKQADILLNRLIERLWNGKQFVTRQSFSDKAYAEGDSLLNFIPIVLGDRLPREQRQALARELMPDGRFVTPYGPATENPDSPLYVTDGYWRGPIWAPSTLLIVDGLARAGFSAQAREIARRFCDMCLQSMTFSENFDPRNGYPLRDPGYTLTASAFLVMAHEWLQ